MTYTSATEDAKRIRAELKALGWNQKHVSVRARTYSMGSSVDVTIKTATPDFEAVKRIAVSAESVRRCEATGKSFQAAIGTCM